MCLYGRTINVFSTTFRKDIPVFVKCGKCIECVIERQNSYKLRLCYEARRWKHCFFFTLTYRNDSLPLAVNYDTGEVISTCCKDHVRSWLKIMRQRYVRHYNSNFQFKYFICSEYGSTDDYVDDRGIVRKATGRPHYHGIIFCNDHPLFVKQMFREWSKSFGRVDSNELKVSSRYPSDLRTQRSKVANYVAKYCCKGEFSSRVDEVEAGYIEPSWLISSHGIGSNYVDDFRDYHLRQGNLYSFNMDYLPPGPFTLDSIDSWFKAKKGTIREEYAKQVWEYVNDVVDNLFVYDGTYKYRLPRYYRQKIFGTKKEVDRIRLLGYSLKFDFDFARNYTPLHGRFCRRHEILPRSSETFKVSVPTSENFLSQCIAYVLRYRNDIDSAQEYYSFVLSQIGKDTSTIIHNYHSMLEAKRQSRANSQRSKLRSFYQYNHLVNSQLSV